MITAELVASVPLFAAAGEEDRAIIASRAADVRVHGGEWLIHEGELPAFFALLEGRVEIIKDVDGACQTVGSVEPGEFIGELSLVLGAPMIAGLRAAEPTRALRLESGDFRDLLARCQTVNHTILATMARRITSLQQVAAEMPVATVTVVGPHWDSACYDLRDFLARNKIAFRWLEPDDATPRRLTLSADVLTSEKYPVVVLPDSSTLVAPPYRVLAERLGLQTSPRQVIYDVAVVGAGPAGLAAAVYGASEGLQTILIERDAPGGQAGTSSRIENYLGFPAGLSGDELSSRALHQARRFGAEVLVARTVTLVDQHAPPGVHVIVLDGDDRIEARSLVLSTGVTWRRLEVPGADRLLGRGVYYGAARTEALGTRGKDVFLIGGGNSAGQAAMLFSNYARSVRILVRGDALAASMSRYLIDELTTKDNVSVDLGCEVVEIAGEQHLESITIKNRRTGDVTTCAADSLFVFIGAQAETSWVPDCLIRDERGYVCTGRDVVDLLHASANQSWPLERDPYLLETSVPGIFAAGDVRHGSLKRVASSVGEGSTAIAFVHEYLAELADKNPAALA